MTLLSRWTCAALLLPALLLPAAAAGAAGSAKAPQALPSDNMDEPEAKPDDKLNPTMDPKRRDTLLKDFSSLSRGWYLNERCNTLSPPLRRELEWSIEQVANALKPEVGAARLNDVQRQAGTTAKEQACGPDARAFGTATMSLARRTAPQVSGAAYAPELGLRKDANRIVRIRFAQKLDDKCKFMPAKVRQEFDSRLALILADFTADAGERITEKTDAAAEQAMVRNQPECDAKSTRFVEQALIIAKLLSPGWKAK